MPEAPIWRAVLGELEITTSKANFQTWLRNTKLMALTSDEAVISVPNVFIRDWLEKHYKDQFISSFGKNGAPVGKVTFSIGEVRSSAPVLEEVGEEEIKREIVPPTKRKQSTTIIPHHTFDTFIVGNNNRLAYNVSLATAKSPGNLHNPLFLYGGVGLGKTHLMHAVANEVLAQQPDKQVLYVSCETFMNDYIAGIASKKMDQFKKTYRSVDILLIDDIQFISNKEGTQEEFFNTFNTLHQSNRQIVIAADRPPKAIPGLEERLSSRFGWGMIADIQSPNLETRTAILQSKCQEKHVTLPKEALEYIAIQIQSNIRELEGALNRTITYSQMMNVPYSLEATRAALSGLIVPAHKKSFSPDAVLHLIAEHFGVALDDLIGKKRTKELVYPRQITMYILREELKLSFPEIGRELGGKDHTTIMHGYHKINAELDNAPNIQHDISAIRERLISQ